MTEIAKNNDNLVDVAMRSYNGVQGLMILEQNPALVFTADVAKGDSLEIDLASDSFPQATLPQPTIEKKPAVSHTYSVIKGQSLIDIAVQEYGSVEGLQELIELNASITSIQYAPDPEEILIVGTGNQNQGLPERKRSNHSDRNRVIAEAVD